MNSLIAATHTKKATNLSVNAQLLAEAKTLKINISAVLEEALKQKIAQVQQQQWLLNNTKQTEAYNTFVEQSGTFADNERLF